MREQKNVNFHEKLRYITFFLDSNSLSIAEISFKHFHDILVNRPEVLDVGGNTIASSGLSKVRRYRGWEPLL